MPIQLVLEQPNLRKGESNFCVIHTTDCSVLQGTRVHELHWLWVLWEQARGWVDCQGGGIVVLSALERLSQVSLVVVAEHLPPSFSCWWIVDAWGASRC